MKLKACDYSSGVFHWVMCIHTENVCIYETRGAFKRIPNNGFAVITGFGNFFFF